MPRGRGIWRKKMNNENQLVEYKRELTDNFERPVVAFLNSKTGGHIYVGIADNGSVYGVKDTDLLQRQITDRIINNIKPATIGLFEVVAEQLKAFTSRAKTSLSKISSPNQDLRFSQLKIYYDENKKILNQNFAKTLELTMPDGSYNYNAYLLSDENGVSIKVARYSGKDKYDLIESEEFGYCCLIKAVKSVLTRLQVANITRTKITPTKRIEKPLVDPIALKEAVINAVVHNDYTREVPPLFEIFSDRMEITTYGGLVEGLSKEDFLSCCSMPRNRELMRIFHDLDLVEQLGSGMRRILNVYNESIFSFTDHFMRTSFYFDENEYKLGDELGDKLGDELGSKLGSSYNELNNNRKRILELIEIDSRISIAQIAEKMGFSTTAIEKNIDYLKENGYLKRIGKTRSGYWEIIKRNHGENQ